MKPDRLCDTRHMREGVRVYVGGEAPGFRDFATSALRIIAVLEELAEYHDRENAEWTVTSAAVGSLATVLHAPECERVESIFIEGVARLRDILSRCLMGGTMRQLESLLSSSR